MWILPQYEVVFTCASGEEKVRLTCSGYEEVTQLVPILLRSGFGTFAVEHLSEMGVPTGVSNTGTDQDAST